jgi:hypothetical protein
LQFCQKQPDSGEPAPAAAPPSAQQTSTSMPTGEPQPGDAENGPTEAANSVREKETVGSQIAGVSDSKSATG